MAFLEVKNLTVKYGEFTALDKVSFNLEKNETLAILGPNGAGKSTLFKCILGLVEYEGEINWPEGKPKIGYVPQRLDFDKTIPISVLEFILLYSKSKKDFWLPSKVVKDKVKKVLSFVGAEHLLLKRIGKLSSGQFQRVLIARALFNEPKLLLFDEPTADIDVEGEMTIYPLLKKLSKELSFSLIIISHDLNIVLDFADKVVCLNKKKMCFGDPKSVLTPDQLNKLYGAEVGFHIHHHDHI